MNALNMTKLWGVGASHWQKACLACMKPPVRWWHLPVIPAFRRPRKEDEKLKVILSNKDFKTPCLINK